MANCTICGKQVLSGKVHHAACWEQAVEAVAEVFCDEYCRFPREAATQEECDEHCSGCAIIKLLNLGV